MMFTNRQMTGPLLSLLSLLSLASVQTAHASVASELHQYETARALEALLDATGDEAGAEVLSGLVDDLARAFLNPSAGDGLFMEADDSLMRATGLHYKNGPGAAAVVARVEKVLRGGSTGSQTICIGRADAKPVQMTLSEQGEQVLLAALGVDAELIAPSEYSRVEFAGRTMTVSPAFLGVDLYQALRSRDQVVLSLQPMPQWEPVKLSLKTTRGETVTIPVELKGARRKLEIEKNTKWVFDDSSTRIPFDSRSVGQRALLDHALQYGVVRLGSIEEADHHPTANFPVDGFRRQLFVLGTGSRWLWQTDITIRPNLQVQRKVSGCDLRISLSAGPDVVMVGPMPLSAWARVSGFRFIDPERVRPEVSYLKAPKSAGASKMRDGSLSLSSRPGPRP